MSKKELLEGCEWKKLGDVLLLLKNGISKEQNQNNSGLPVTRIETISNGTINFDKVGYISDLEAETIERYKLIEGDILFSHINSLAHIGKTAIYENYSGLLLHGVNLLLLRPNKNLIVPKYLHYVLKYMKEIKYFWTMANKAINQASINQFTLTKIEIPVPPLDIQNKIVSKLDEQMAQIELMKKEAKKQKEILFSLFPSYLSEKFGEKIPKEQLGNLVYEIKNGVYKPSLFREKGHKLVRMYNIENDSIELNDNNLELIELTSNEIEKYTLRKDDIIISRVNSSELVGKCGIVKDKLIGYAFENMVIRVRVDPKKIIPDYLAYFLISPKGKEEMKSRARHAINQSSINNEDLSNIPVSLPPNVDIQKEIVYKLDSKFELVRELKKQIEIELNAIEYLQSSILNEVFGKYEIPGEV